MQHHTPPKPLFFIASAHKDLLACPEDVKDDIGYALYRVQLGETPRSAKSLKGFGGATVLEIRADDESGTYRAVYTVRFAGVVYALHVFQKKAKQGIATPQAAIDLIKQRLVEAQAHYQEWLRAQQGDSHDTSG